MMLNWALRTYLTLTIALLPTQTVLADDLVDYCEEQFGNDLLPENWDGQDDPLYTPPPPAESDQDNGGGDETATSCGDLSAEFMGGVSSIAGFLGTDPYFLLAAMSFETGGTFSPSKRNSLSGATGLIQFMPSTARSLGTTTDALARMTREEQLVYVRKYFASYGGRLRTLEDTYMAILWPRAVGKPNSYALFRRGTVEYSQNAGLDINRDGVVTKEEAASKVRNHYNAVTSRCPNAFGQRQNYA
ncbi:hypothetical protein JNK13_00485 [bacterium]|nr:hypothetical protein [bacterium]